VTVDATIYHQSGTGDSGILPAFRKVFCHQRHLECAGHIEHVNLCGGDQFGKPVIGTVNDIGVPICLNKGVA